MPTIDDEIAAQSQRIQRAQLLKLSALEQLESAQKEIDQAAAVIAGLKFAKQETTDAGTES